MIKFDIQEQLDGLSREEQLLRRRCTKTPRNLLGVSHFVLQTALSILSLSNMSYNMATAWIMDPNRRGLKTPKHITNENVRSVLEEIVLEASAEEIVTWGDREFCSNQTSLRVATDYVRKFSLVQRVAICNTVYEKPLPSIHVVRNYYEENSMTETRGALLESRPRNNRESSGHRMWAVRWRKNMVSNAAEYDSESL